MYRSRWTISVTLLLVAGFLAAFKPAVGRRTGQDDALWAVIDADDRRDGSNGTLADLLTGAASDDSVVNIVAVRALGRAERPGWLQHLRDPLWSNRPYIRAEAANAVAQAVFSGPWEEAYRLLVERLAIETDPSVRGRIAQALGRLPYSTVQAAQQAEAEILAVTDNAEQLPVARALESLTRQQNRSGYRLSENTARFLVGLMTNRSGPNGAALQNARIRRMALSALVAGGQPDRETIESALGDADAGVRRLAIVAAASLQAADRATLIMEAPFDASPMVRYEILRLYGRFMRSEEGCLPLRETVGDTDPHVGLLAVDLMGQDCVLEENIPRFLTQVVAALPVSSEEEVDGWYYPAHALVALAYAAPDSALQVLNRFENYSQWQVRVYAAQAAAVLGDVAALYRLAKDEHWNVRTAAIGALQPAVHHEADSVYIENLGAADYQLVMTAARGLEGSPNAADAIPALKTSLARLTRERKDTSRDPRTVLITRIGELGSAEDADDLRPYVSDFDHTIAASAAGILSGWLGETVNATPKPLPRPAVPSVSQLRVWQQTVVTLHMRGGGLVDIALRPFDAPTNVARFVRLAESGYFDGLTFHRVEPNFVIQGGSHGANEYAGDGPYTRDELTMRAHWRGTVGLSTRGRDTGDGQLFVNLIDNVRLDHNYTMFGEVIDGMDVVDAVMEGATIERVSMRVEDGND